jgi:hypothetical protein
MTSHPDPVPNASAEARLSALETELAQVVARVFALEQQLATAVVPVTTPAAAPALPEVALPAEHLAPPPRAATPQGEIRAVLAAMFDLAMRPPTQDDEQADLRYRAFSDLFHHTRRGSPLLENELMNYKWRPLCTRAASYLRDAADPSSFDIVQMVPAVVDDRTATIKVFLRAERRMPPPVTFRRDDMAEGALRIESSSL